MNKSIQLFAEALILVVLVVCVVFAGGYQLNEQGARAVGMGGAFVARASDPSAIYFNPAGLASQKGINVLGGLSLIMPSTTFKGNAPLPTTETAMNSQVFTPINLYGTYQLDDEFVVGLGIFNPFGNGTEWPDNWIGKTASVKADLQTWYINPSIAYKVDDEISVGLGISYVYSSVKMTRKVQTGATTYGDVSLDGTGSGFNVNFGGIYKPMEGLSIGLSYRIQTDIEFDGDFKSPAGTLKGKATLPMPGNLLVGAAYEVMPELTVEVDIQYIQWSAYKNLTITLTPGGVQPADVKNWGDGIMLRGGAEYKLDPEVTLRGGLILDLSPQPPSKTEPMLPDGDRVDISLGGSYKIDENLSIDAAYMLVLFMERDAKNAALSGTYNSNAHIFSVNVGYTF